MKEMLLLSFLFLGLASYAYAQGMNVAIGQAASQYDTLAFMGFNWTAERVVDNCTLQDDPNTQGCCAASLGTTENYIRVDFDETYNISHIVLFGRADSSQTKDFLLTILTGSGTETVIYDNSCCEYGDGIFTILVNDTSVDAIIVTRPTESILTVCEIQAFETIPPTDAPMVTVSSTLDPGHNASTGQGQNTTQTTLPTSTLGQTGQTTGTPNTVPRMLKYSEVIMLLFLNALFVWKYK